MDAPTAYPLAWPPGWPRTAAPVNGSFRTKRLSDSHWPGYRPVTVPVAIERLRAELEKLGARYPVVSTNLALRRDGLPYADAKTNDPGVCVYFTLDGKQIALPCDRYTTVAQNIAAIAAHIEATRAIERYGVATVSAMFAGFLALPAPSQGGRPWRSVLGFFPDERPTISQVEAARRSLLREMLKDGTPPDSDTLKALNVAVEEARKELAP